MRDLVSGFLELSLADVERCGGTGPAIYRRWLLAVFGAPLSHEDHVRRALLTAAGIQRRIGVHTGPVVFGQIAEACRLIALSSVTRRMLPPVFSNWWNRGRPC